MLVPDAIPALSSKDFCFLNSDSDTEQKLCEKPWDIVLLGCIVTGYRIVKDVVSKIKAANPESLIVVGNSVASSIPGILLEKTQADVAVIGEGDRTAVDIIESWLRHGSLKDVKGIYYKEKDRIVINAPRTVIEDVNTIPIHAYDIFEVERYIAAHKNVVGEPLPMDRDRIRSFPINTARGCINHCTFCYHCFVNEKYRYRSAASIVDEIKVLQERYDINYIHLWDDLTFFSRSQLAEFVTTLNKEKVEVYWSGAVRGNLFQDNKDLDLLFKLKDAGCLNFGYALESADKSILKEMKKKVSLSEFKKQKSLLDKAGIASGTSIVLGYPAETPETIAKTYQFCLDLGLYPSTGFLLPQPGTPIYQWAIENQFIQDEEAFLLSMGDRQDLRINLTSMAEAEFVGTVEYWLKKLNKSLNLGLPEASLIKTQFKRNKKN